MKTKFVIGAFYNEKCVVVVDFCPFELCTTSIYVYSIMVKLHYYVNGYVTFQCWVKKNCNNTWLRSNNYVNNKKLFGNFMVKFHSNQSHTIKKKF